MCLCGAATKRTKRQDLRRRTVGRRLPDRTGLELGGSAVVRGERDARPGRFTVLDVRRRVPGRQRAQERGARAAG